MTAAIFTGCSTTTTAVTIKANWYSQVSQENIVSINEKVIYNIRYDDTDNSNTDMSISDFRGTYEMALNTDSENNLYILKTKQTNISGKYVGADAEYDISNDTIETETKFKSVKNNLKPVSSYKKYSAYSPLSDGTAVLYEYEYSTVYEGSNATVTLLSHSENYTNHKDTITYTKIDKSNLYFDNDQLLFAIRSLSLDKSFSATVSAISPVDEKLQSINIKVSDAEPFVTFNLKNLGVLENGVLLTDDKTISAIKTTVVLNATMTGNSIICYYAVNNSEYVNYRSRLIKMETSLPYKLGGLVYTLNSVEYSES